MDSGDELTGWGDDPNDPEHVEVGDSSKDDDVFAVRHRATEAVREKARELAEKGAESVAKVKAKANEIRRRVITGDKSKRVRDFVLEQPVVKSIDKITFLFAILILNAIQYILCMSPQSIEPFMLLVMPLLLLLRVRVYVPFLPPPAASRPCRGKPLQCCMCVCHRTETQCSWKRVTNGWSWFI